MNLFLVLLSIHSDKGIIKFLLCKYTCINPKIYFLLQEKYTIMNLHFWVYNYMDHNVKLGVFLVEQSLVGSN